MRPWILTRRDNEKRMKREERMKKEEKENKGQGKYGVFIFKYFNLCWLGV